jgi:hypothetical protein
MRDNLLYHLREVIDASDYLLQETILNDLQRKFLHSIHSVAVDLRQIIMMTPDEFLTHERARELFSFETREHLASVIGYAEVLSEKEEGPLNDVQAELITIIESNAIQVFDTISNIIE